MTLGAASREYPDCAARMVPRTRRCGSTSIATGLDPLFARYYPEHLNRWKPPTEDHSGELRVRANGGRKYLYHNSAAAVRGGQRTVGFVSPWALAAVAADLRGLGPDLFIANDYGVSELFINEGGRFREVGRETGVGFAPKSGMNASVGDVLNQGKLAIYVSNISEEGILLQGNNLWVPTGAKGVVPRYENMATAMGVDLGGWSFGAQFGDLNNDGFLDLYVTNGYVSADRNENYWYDFSKVAGGHRVVIGDAANWPAMGTRSLAGYQAKKVWINDGPRIRDVAQWSRDRPPRRPRGRARDWCDSSLDVIVANQRGPLLLYRNHVPAARQWIAFDLQGGCRDVVAVTEPCSNRSAIGARVEVFWNGRQQAQEVSGGSGFCAQNQRRLHFGLGTVASVDRVVNPLASARLMS